MRRELEAAIRELEQVARAQLAADIGGELDLAAREADRDVRTTDQESLL